MAKYCPYCAGRIDSGTSCPHCSYSYTYKPKPHHLRPGTILRNKYLVGKVLGEGGFGITYVGRDLTLDMKVAIKEYYPSNMARRNIAQSTQLSLNDWSFSTQFKFGKEQFIYEAQTIAKMDKESAVVTVRDFFEDNNSAYIVMEYIEGRDLRYFMQKLQKPLSPDDLLPLLEPLFGALTELHNIGLIHRDISPDNIMVENGRARLIDFGCARDTIDGNNSDIILKHGFSPIEQYKNKNMGPWSDVYAMAATIYYCLSGKRPPNAIDRVGKDELQSLSSMGVKLRPKQEKALMKALSIDPRNRYQNMADFAKDLFIHKNKYKLIAAAACAVAVLSLAGLLLFKPGTRVETMREAKSAVEYLSAADDISSDEKKMLDQISDIIADAELRIDNDGYYNISLENSSDYDVFANFALRAYNSAGAVVANASVSGGEWKQGVTLAPRLFINASDVEEVQVRANITYKERHLRTEFIPVSVSEENKGLVINLVNQLPSTFSYAGWNYENKYTITSFRMEYDQLTGSCSVDFFFGGSFDSGVDNGYGYVDYRLTDASGAVVDTGTLSFNKLRVGDRFENFRVSLFGIAPGEYNLELSDYDS